MMMDDTTVVGGNDDDDDDDDEVVRNIFRSRGQLSIADFVREMLLGSQSYSESADAVPETVKRRRKVLLIAKYVICDSPLQRFVTTQQFRTFLARCGPFSVCIRTAWNNFFEMDDAVTTTSSSATSAVIPAAPMYIPQGRARPRPKLMSWYHGKISRQTSTELLRKEIDESQGIGGGFLIRESETHPDKYTVVYTEADSSNDYPSDGGAQGGGPVVRNVLIFNLRGRGYAIGQRTSRTVFPSLRSFVSSYNSILRRPIVSEIFKHFRHNEAPDVKEDDDSGGSGGGGFAGGDKRGKTTNETLGYIFSSGSLNATAAKTDDAAVPSLPTGALSTESMEDPNRGILSSSSSIGECTANPNTPPVLPTLSTASSSGGKINSDGGGDAAHNDIEVLESRAVDMLTAIKDFEMQIEEEKIKKLKFVSECDCRILKMVSEIGKLKRRLRDTRTKLESVDPRSATFRISLSTLSPTEDTMVVTPGLGRSRSESGDSATALESSMSQLLRLSRIDATQRTRDATPAPSSSLRDSLSSTRPLSDVSSVAAVARRVDAPSLVASGRVGSALSTSSERRDARAAELRAYGFNDGSKGTAPANYGFGSRLAKRKS